MTGALAKKFSKADSSRGNLAIAEPRWVRYLLISTTLAFLAFFLLMPLLAVFVQAFEKGAGAFYSAVTESDALASIRLTLFVAAIAVPLNTLFGVSAAWAISKFEFWGKSVLITIIDLPYSISPVISGLVFVMLFGRQGWFGPFLEQYDIQLIFSVSGVVLATLFVTFPFVARELIPLMQSQGSEEEEAARVLGASGWRILWRITLPNIKWGLLYGVILCNARAMGEFGAVSVVSGHLRGETLTMPLQVQIFYDEYNATAAFALASLLAGLAIVTLILKSIMEWKVADHKTIKAQAYIGE
jgi:sulfate/thiosulfate transport system permease protein